MVCLTEPSEKSSLETVWKRVGTHLAGIWICHLSITVDHWQPIKRFVFEQIINSLCCHHQQGVFISVELIIPLKQQICIIFVFLTHLLS